MLGTKIRNFAPLPGLSLEELVPQDNFYRRLEATLVLSLVRDLVSDCYASSSGSSSCAWKPDRCGARSSK